MEFNEEDTLAIGDTTKLWLDETLQERVKWLNHEVFEEYFDEDIANNETLKIIVSCTDCRDEQLRLKVYSVVISRFLREINFWDSRSTKFAILTHLEALNSIFINFCTF